MKRKKKSPSRPSAPCRPGACSCGGGLNRRDFLAVTGLGAAGALASGLPVMAGPFDESDYTTLIPGDKKLDPKWVESLFARGEPAVYRGDALDRIGMPVGGICSGQLYLGGDGRLWLFDLFNQISTGVMGKGQNGENYVNPLEPQSPIEQGFTLRVAFGGRSEIRPLDRSGFEDVAFQGAYPIGRVDYRDQALPVTVSLEAFSPFIPLDAENSSHPATVLQYTVKNVSEDTVEAEILGRLQNGVCIHHDEPGLGIRRNRIFRRKGLTFLECSAEEPPKETGEPPRPDIPFENFEKGTYDGWTVTGTAFGREPIVKDGMPAYQGDVGSEGERLVNTHNTRQGEDVKEGDAHTGTLESPPFTIERRYVTFLIGGGAHAGKTCVDLVVDGETVRTATGRNDNRMQPHSFDVRDLAGKTARIRVVDSHSGGWGNIGIDDIVFSDRPRRPPLVLKELSDFGTMGLALLHTSSLDSACAALPDGAEGEGLFEAVRAGEPAEGTTRPFGQPLSGALSRKMLLKPGREAKATFLLTWHFPNLSLRGFPQPVGRHYANRFDSALAVAGHVSDHSETLARHTRLWVDTWYDSTLPCWFLDRTFANTSTLATSTVYRFANGRFYGFEGIGCCPGTCTHVWHYAQAVGRLFPELERDLRERVDFGLAFNEDTGVIGHRGELYKDSPAHDGQAGVILRALREHRMSPDGAFLERNWPKIRKALAYLIDLDRDFDGIIEGAQPNTLDAAWFGKIAWLTSLYLAALRAGEEMAREMKDNGFALKCRGIFERGRELIVRLLWNGEYFIQIPDPGHMDAIGADTGCYIDQVFGQSWAHQLSLGRLYSEQHIRGALQSLWKYNFAPDVGPFKAVYTKGRPYALAGDGGLIMCTWPKGGKRKDWEKHWQYMYFNECMSGFEYQAAGHMIFEGMVKEGLAVARVIHDRYSAHLRNPYNEIECSDHYARAMASYGAFLAACGYEYHGPKGHLGFAPRLNPDDFRAAFTAAEGWGRISQERKDGLQRQKIEVRWGRLRLRTLAFRLPEATESAKVRVTAAGDPIGAKHLIQEGRLTVALEEEAVLEAGQSLEVMVT